MLEKHENNVLLTLKLYFFSKLVSLKLIVESKEGAKLLDVTNLQAVAANHIRKCVFISVPFCLLEYKFLWKKWKSLDPFECCECDQFFRVLFVYFLSYNFVEEGGCSTQRQMEVIACIDLVTSCHCPCV